MLKDIKTLFEDVSEIKKRIEEITTIDGNCLNQIKTLQKLVEDSNCSSKLQELSSKLIDTGLINRNLILKELSYQKENYWANLFHDTSCESDWFIKKSVSPGRWAISYVGLYLIYRVLDEMRPLNILECGLGQTSKLTIQYAEHFNANLFICEQDPNWTKFFSNSFPMCTKYVRHFPVEMIKVFEDFESRVYKGFDDFLNEGFKRFDFVLIDAPIGTKRYSRIDLLKVVEHLSDDFVVILDDVNRKGERETLDLFHKKLQDERGDDFVNAIYKSDKSVSITSSKKFSFLTSI